MKKQIIVSSFIAAAILGGTAILSVAKAEEGPKETGKLIAANSSLITPNPIINNTGTETVYVMGDENGNVKSKFIGSTIYNGAEELPFTMKVTYYLDGVEISAADLAGKSGHVKIVFNYNSTAKYNGRFIPFLALTTLNLDHSKFSNIRLNNGKIFNENSSAYTILGYGLTRLNANLGTDFLPDTFIFEADTTSFKMADTYTIFINDILADIDLSELNRLDDLKNAIYKLEDATNKLVNGAAELSNGIAKTIDGTKTIYAGSQTIATKTQEAATGASELKNGLETAVANNAVLKTGADNLIDTTIAQVNASGLIPVTVTRENYSQILPEEHTARKTIDFGFGIINYINGISAAATGAATLSTGLTQLVNGATTLSNGLGVLLEGENQLYQGSITLRDGLSTFKTSGIDKLVSFADKDLTNFTRNLRASVTAAGSYKSFGGVNAKSVKFIVKTPSI